MNPQGDMGTSYLQNVLGASRDALWALREIPPFRHASMALLELVYRYGRVFHLKEGELLTKEGDFDQWVFFILSGKLGVYVGGALVDTTSTSMVGERCILGEPRRATIKAHQGSLTALGVDMAVLDQMRETRSGEADITPTYIELLGVITSELVCRIADLEFNQRDLQHKYVTYRHSDHRSTLVQGLSRNEFVEDRRVNLEIYKYLQRFDKGLLASCLAPNQVQVDTGHLYALAVSQGRTDLVLGLAGYLAEQGVGGAEEMPPKVYVFHDFASSCALEALAQNQEMAKTRALPRHLNETLWSERFQLRDDLTVDLNQLARWLQTDMGYTPPETIEALMIVFREATGYNGLINATMKTMVTALTQISFIKKLEAAQDWPPNLKATDFLSSHTLEDLMPVISKTILHVHLIAPFLERMGISLDETAPAAPAAGAKPPEAAQNTAQSKELLNQLFG